MIAIALRSTGQRKLSTALTAIAILLGVAMIAGTYIQTDQIRAAFDDILLLAWLTPFAVNDLGVGISVPVPQLVAFLGLPVVVGAVGAIAPARRAARLNILDAVHSE